MFPGIPCVKCGGLLIVDEASTTNLYNKKMFYEFEDVNKLVESMIDQRIVFTCRMCKSEELLTYEDWMNRFRKHTTEKILQIRTIHLLTLHKNNIDETSGVSYCGGCLGYGGDGWCLNCIIEKCGLGKLKNNGV